MNRLGESGFGEKAKRRVMSNRMNRDPPVMCYETKIWSYWIVIETFST